LFLGEWDKLEEAPEVWFAYSKLSGDDCEDGPKCEKLVEDLNKLFGVEVRQDEVIAKVNGEFHMEDETLLHITIGRIMITIDMNTLSKTITRDSQGRLIIAEDAKLPASIRIARPAEFDFDPLDFLNRKSR